MIESKFSLQNCSTIGNYYVLHNFTILQHYHTNMYHNCHYMAINTIYFIYKSKLNLFYLFLFEESHIWPYMFDMHWVKSLLWRVHCNEFRENEIVAPKSLQQSEIVAMIVNSRRLNSLLWNRCSEFEELLWWDRYSEVR